MMTDRIYSLVAISLFLIAVALSAADALVDGDFWWQMEYGRQMLERGSLVVDHSLYSWTPTDYVWIYCAWIAEILLYLIYETFGMIGVAALRFLILTLPAVLVVFLFVKREKMPPLWIWLLGFLSYYCARHAGGLLKPELFGHLFFSLLVFSYFQFKLSIISFNRALIQIYLILLLWINSHGTFVLGGAFVAIVALGELINQKVFKRSDINWDQWKTLLKVSPLFLLILVLTPYGLEYPKSLLETIFSDRTHHYFSAVTAYSSIFGEGFEHIGFLYFITPLVLVFLLFTVHSLRHRQLDFAVLLSNVFFIYLLSGWGRASYFSPILLFFSIAYLNLSGGVINSRFDKGFWKHMVAALTIGVMSYSAFYVPNTLQGADGRRGPKLSVGYLNPKEEAHFFQTYFSDLKLCNGYNGGGYLLWKYRGDPKIMLDPRQFPYRTWYSDWLRFRAGHDMEAQIQDWGCQAWILNHNYEEPHKALIQSSEWQMLFVGPAAIVYVKTSQLDSSHKLEIHPKVYEVKGLHRTGLILNNLLMARELDHALEVSNQNRINSHYQLWEDQAVASHEFVKGTVNYYRKNNVTAFKQLRSAKEGESLISNARRLQLSGQFAVLDLWQERNYAEALRISEYLVELIPEDVINLYNTGMLTLLSNGDNNETWIQYLSQFLELANSNSSVPALYMEYAREMLRTGEKNTYPPLKPVDPRK